MHDDILQKYFVKNNLEREFITEKKSKTQIIYTDLNISWRKIHGKSEWVSEWVSEWMSEWVSEWVSEGVSEWVNEWVSEWVSEWASEWVSQWVSQWHLILFIFKVILFYLTLESNRQTRKQCKNTSSNIFMKNNSNLSEVKYC